VKRVLLAVLVFAASAVAVVAALVGRNLYNARPLGPLPYPNAEAHPADTVWPQYGGTFAAQRYSTLDQINRGNVGRLHVAWTYHTGDLARMQKGEEPFNPLEATPILAAGSLVGCTPAGRVFALDPATGQERWTFDPKSALSPIGHSFVKCRGVSSFDDAMLATDAPCRIRILWGTGDLRVFALDARTGERCAGFGVEGGPVGEVQLDPGTNLAFPHEVQIHSPPAMVGEVAVFGSTLADMVRTDAPSGMIRAIDARSGRLLWTFDPVPRNDADPAAASWGNGSNRVAGAGNVWSLISADPANELVFLPTTSPSADIWGGNRPGENRYADSLVALRARTGEVAWHQQIVHHDLWDYDLPAQPIVVDLPRDGGTVPAVVQVTKQGMIFVFNRLTGEPVFPVEERAVAQGDVPGEWYSPTQPFSSLPALVQQGVKAEDAWGFTFWDRDACRRKIEGLRSAGLYTPPSLVGTIYMPASAGGANWGGAAIDPNTGLLIVDTLHMPAVMRLMPREKWDGKIGSVETGLHLPQSGTPYVTDLSFLVSPLGAPCTPPPWSRLTAVDLAKGTVRWQVPLGNVGKIAPVPIPLELGGPLAGGAIMTKGGLAFIAATADERFRAFDLETGAKLWETELPASGNATPMTYAIGGRQFVVLMAGGHPYYGKSMGDAVVAYALAPS
jgi:quinoprotein glucose dehydrogenase